MFAGAARPEAADGVLVVQVLQRVERGGLRAGRQQQTQTHQTGHVLKEHLQGAAIDEVGNFCWLVFGPHPVYIWY